MLDRINDTLSGLVGQGRNQAEVMRVKRQRYRLVHELGDLYYRSRTGAMIPAGEIERHIAEIASLDQAAEEPVVDSMPSDNNGTSDEDVPSA